MTDYLTDEHVNEAIAVKRGWVLKTCACGKSGCHDWWMMPDGGVDYNQTDPPDYTHDWRLCGELLEEMKADDPGVFYMDEGTNSKYWRAQVNILWRDAPTPQRAICEAWLEWKEQK